MSTRHFFPILLLLLVGCGTSKGLVGRWERPDGSAPLVFARDGSCQVGISSVKDGTLRMLGGTYTVAPDGKISIVARGEGITLTEYYHFEGDRLTDGAVFFGEGKRYWLKRSR